MPASPFQIEFNYDEIPYVGIVTPFRSGSETWYSVQLESENQETHITLIAKPSESSLEDWSFACEDEGDPLDYYDKDLLVEIGEAIEVSLGASDQPEDLGI